MNDGFKMQTIVKEKTYENIDAYRDSRVSSSTQKQANVTKDSGMALSLEVTCGGN